MCLRGRSPTLRHTSRTHRVDLDWLIERIKVDPGIRMKYVGTNQQMADMLTKASFTVQKWLEMLKLHQTGELACQKSAVYLNKNSGQKQIHGSVVLAQRETESLRSAVCLDCIPRCLFAMSAAASSTDWVPPPPPGLPPGHIKGLVLKQLPRPVAPTDFSPVWTDDDLAEGDLMRKLGVQESELEEFAPLRDALMTSMEARKFSYTRREMIKLESQLKGSAADPGNLDMKIINAEHEKRDEQLCEVGMKI